MQSTNDINFLELAQSQTPLADLIHMCDKIDHGKAATWVNLATKQVLYCRELMHVGKVDGEYDMRSLSSRQHTSKTCDVIEAIVLSAPLCQDAVFRVRSDNGVKDVVVGRFVDGFATVRFNMMAVMYTSVSLVLDQECDVTVRAGYFGLGLRKTIADFTREGQVSFKNGQVV